MAQGSGSQTTAPTTTTTTTTTTTIRTSVNPTTGAVTTTTITQSDNGETTTFNVTNSTTTSSPSGQTTTTSTSATFTADSTTLATGDQGSFTVTQIQNSTVTTTPNPDGSSTLSSSSTTIDTTSSTVTESQIDFNTTSDGQVHKNSTSTTTEPLELTSSTQVPTINPPTEVPTSSTISSTISSIASSLASSAATAISSTFLTSSSPLGVSTTSSLPGNFTNSTNPASPDDKSSGGNNTALIAGVAVAATFVAAAGIYLARRYGKQKRRAIHLDDLERSAQHLELELQDPSGTTLTEKQLIDCGIIKRDDSQNVKNLKSLIATSVKHLLGTQDEQNIVLAHNYRVALAILRKKLGLEGRPLAELSQVESQAINDLISQITSTRQNFDRALSEYNRGLGQRKKLAVRDGTYLASTPLYLEPQPEYSAVEDTDVDLAFDASAGQGIYEDARERPRAVNIREGDIGHELSLELEEFVKGIGENYDRDSEPTVPPRGQRQDGAVGSIYRNPLARGGQYDAPRGPGVGTEFYSVLGGDVRPQRAVESQRAVRSPIYSDIDGAVEEGAYDAPRGPSQARQRDSQVVYQSPLSLPSAPESVIDVQPAMPLYSRPLPRSQRVAGPTQPQDSQYGQAAATSFYAIEEFPEPDQLTGNPILSESDLYSTVSEGAQPRRAPTSTNLPSAKAASHSASRAQGLPSGAVRGGRGDGDS